MLVQVLAEFADSHLQDAMSDVAWETKPVPCMLEIASDGSFLGVVPTTHEETRGKKIRHPGEPDGSATIPGESQQWASSIDRHR